MKLSNLVGRRFGRLFVVERTENIGGRVAWVCRCDCGRSVTVRAGRLRSGNTASCGCLATDRKRSMHVTHGHSANGRLSGEYIAWANMVRRGSGKINRVNYVDRGITVCDRWLSFESFFADMGKRPAGTSIDRINNDGPYEPGNCRWALRKEQARNTRANHILEVAGRVASIADWAEISGVTASTIWARIARGWTAEDAISRVVDATSWDTRRSMARTKAVAS